MASNQDAVKKYQTTRDAIMLRPSKEDGAKIRQAAADAGMSVLVFMFKLVREFMERHENEK